MGKKRHAPPREYIESLTDTDEKNKYQKEYSTRKHKKAKKSKHVESDSDHSEIESKYERNRQKHKHRKQNKDSRNGEDDSFSNESEQEGTNSYLMHRRKRQKRSKKHGKNQREEEPTSKWDDEVENHIKREPSSDTESQRRLPQPSNTAQRDNREEWGNQSRNPKPKTLSASDKEKANFGLSGKLAEDTNTYNGVVIKYTQPPEARKPKRRWRWYIFRGEDELPFLPLHRQSAYLIGRERKVADIPTDHPSCSKQHAVFQYRLVAYDRADGTKGRTVKPYILDLESANGTYVNNRRIEARRYVELLEKDVVKFGYSSREYVLLHEASKGEDDEMSQEASDTSPITLLRRN